MAYEFNIATRHNALSESLAIAYNEAEQKVASEFGDSVQVIKKHYIIGS